MQLVHAFGSALCIEKGMINAFATPDTTWMFFGLLVCLLITSVALFWSIEDQRARRRVSKD
jgi:hypothetical protein